MLSFIVNLLMYLLAMLNLTKKIILLLSIGLISSNSFAGGGWVKKKGEGYYKMGESTIYATKYFNSSGDIVKIVTTGYYSTYLYSEIGLGKKFEAYTYFPFLTRVVKNRVKNSKTGNEIIPGDQLTSLGDMDLGLKYGLIQDKAVVWSTSVVFKLPFGNASGGNSQLLQTGDGAFSQLLRTDISAATNRFHTSIFFGVRHRGKSYSDEFQNGFELGWNNNRKFYIIGKLNSVLSFYNSKVSINDEEITSIFANNTEYISPSLEFAYVTDKKWGFSIYGQGAIKAKNILAAPTLGVGIFYDIKK